MMKTEDRAGDRQKKKPARQESQGVIVAARASTKDYDHLAVPCFSLCGFPFLQQDRTSQCGHQTAEDCEQLRSYAAGGG